MLSIKPVLLDFCPEILHNILANLKPADVGSISRTCRGLNSYVEGNRLLWKDLYIRNFDHPPHEHIQREPQWEVDLKRFVNLQKILETENVSVKKSAVVETCNTAIHLLQTASADSESSLNISFLNQFFEDRHNGNVFLFSSNLYEQAGAEDHHPASTEEERQATAKLHSYFGTSKEAIGRTRSRAAHPYARAKVYDLRGYTTPNYWGPWMDDGSLRVDWEKVESLMIVLGYNLQMFGERCPIPASKSLMIWHSPFEGVTPNSYTPMPRFMDTMDKNLKAELNFLHGTSIIQEPEPPLEALDPYGVTGTWRRVVCFLDYNDLYSFNFGGYEPNDSRPRPPIIMQEAIRLITMKLRVERIEAPGPMNGKALPVVHFTGTARSMHQAHDPNSNSSLYGTASLTPEGEVRWTTTSLFGGEERWKSESIQVGGLRSARGTIGTWFDKDYDDNGPVGPTAFWKLNDQVSDEKRTGVVLYAGYDDDDDDDD
ncbi:hypothetical protein BLS_002812 [Venturia inaequalis]|uniref:F-box domain-containing protein n=2 Tax=Venturia inaequalis TaxID=5025 RepID=A0A8H3Z5T8_VENIN|nr:hypothetical protein BLS_002812 [Venturia inaequalis]RDI87802.1 hypothetical protein Vi05172_g2410 [Venturia inaequalis]